MFKPWDCSRTKPAKYGQIHQRFTVRHRPETTLLYQVIREYWPEIKAELSGHGKGLPAYVTKEFDEYLKSERPAKMTRLRGALAEDLV